MPHTPLRFIKVGTTSVVCMPEGVPARCPGCGAVQNIHFVPGAFHDRFVHDRPDCPIFLRGQAARRRLNDMLNCSVTGDRKPIDSQHFEFGAIPGFYTITYWPPAFKGVALRLKLHHLSWEDSTEFVCEVRFGPCDEFHQISQGELSSYSIDHPYFDPEDTLTTFLSFPAGWRDEFWTMAERYAALLALMELDCSFKHRYAGEPQTSRDHFECDEVRRSESM